MRILLFNLATDADDPLLGFTTRWIGALAERVEFIHVITMRVGRLEMPANVRVYSVGKEKGYSEPRRAHRVLPVAFSHLTGKPYRCMFFPHDNDLYDTSGAHIET